jgi:SNF2 family DNA or RNA helicase
VESGAANEFINKESANHLSIMVRLRQYTSHLKTSAVIELCDTILETGEKIVIVDVFKESLLALKKHYGDIAGLHTGDQSPEDRSEIVKKFQDPDSDLKIFLGSIQTCNYGLTLTASSKLFILTLPYSVGEYDQVSDRLHRIGQVNAVNIYPLMFLDTIDEYVYGAIEGKRKEIMKVIDNENYSSTVGQSIFSDVIKKIKEKHGK